MASGDDQIGNERYGWYSPTHRKVATWVHVYLNRKGKGAKVYGVTSTEGGAGFPWEDKWPLGQLGAYVSTELVKTPPTERSCSK